MELIRTAHEHGTIIECEDFPNYFGFENIVHNSTTTQIWFIVDEGIEKCTSVTIHKYDFSPTGEVTVQIIAPSFNGTATELENEIDLSKFAIAIANAY